MQLHYPAILNKDPNSAYGITFPDLPGVVSAADDFADVVRMANESLALHFKDARIVRPSRVEDVYETDPSAIRNGGVLISIPFEGYTWEYRLLQHIDNSTELIEAYFHSGRLVGWHCLDGVTGSSKTREAFDLGPMGLAIIKPTISYKEISRLIRTAS